MKKIITGVILLASITFYGQNTFPSSGNVGIGTSIPTKALEIKGNDGIGIRLFNQSANTWDLLNSQYGKLDFIRGGSNVFMRINQVGNVGIGSLNPQKKLEIKGNDGVGIRIFNQNSNTWDILNSQYGKLDFVRGSSNIFMRITQNGRVGIGTENPDKELTVAGTIHCEEVLVDLSVPADYVFQKYYTGFSSLKENYTMPTLEEVAAFTKENHHLPNVPSAATIQEEGLQLKEMTNILLQKIEELTLYTIEQEKRIKALEGKLATEK